MQKYEKLILSVVLLSMLVIGRGQFEFEIRKFANFDVQFIEQ